MARRLIGDREAAAAVSSLAAVVSTFGTSGSRKILQ